jgi:polyphosphate kinase
MASTLQPSETATGPRLGTLVPSGRAQKHVEPRLLNRELSWLDYAERVLALASEPGLPLLERVKLCSIFASNLDEFFEVRVAGLLDQVAAGVSLRSPDGRTPVEALAEVRARVLELSARHSQLWSELARGLAAEGIVVGGIEDCSRQELAELTEQFDQEVFPVLTPLAVGPGLPFPYISALSLSVIVFVRDPDNGEERLARVKVPEGLPRFLPVGKRGLFVPLEAVIAHFLPWLFPRMEIADRAFFRVTRDADFEVSDEADDLLGAVEAELRRRRFGDVVRVEVSAPISPGLLERLRDGLGALPEQVYMVEGLLDLSELSQLVQLDRPELKLDTWAPVTPTRFAAGRGDMFAEISRGEILVHHPYESFAASFEAFVRAAAKEPQVIGLKTTVYRTNDESPLVPALIEASEEGKQSVCVVELQARFDERRNIEWSRALERAGVHVVYGLPNLKIHAKATLVIRREGRVARRYAHIGTGNYHSLTARAYEDFGLFTADKDVTADLADLFNYVTGFGRPEGFRKLLVAPFNLRQRLVELIRAAADAARAGKPARIQIKVNNLSDEQLIAELYAASQAGVRIDLFIRSVCALRAGVPGLSETIQVRSVLGRFLEHSRVFNFEIRRKSFWYLGSADLMPRNLDHRLELLTPVEDARSQQRLSQLFELLLADETAWTLRPDGSWEPPAAEHTVAKHGTQEVLMRNARRRRRAANGSRAGRGR